MGLMPNLKKLITNLPKLKSFESCESLKQHCCVSSLQASLSGLLVHLFSDIGSLLYLKSRRKDLVTLVDDFSRVTKIYLVEYIPSYFLVIQCENTLK